MFLARVSTKDISKLKHSLGSIASLFCFGIYHMPNCKQILMRRNTKLIVPKYPITFHMSLISYAHWWCWLMTPLIIWPINLRLWMRLSIKVICGWIQRVVIFPHNYLELYTSFTIMRLTFISWIFIKFAIFQLKSTFSCKNSLQGCNKTNKLLTINWKIQSKN